MASTTLPSEPEPRGLAELPGEPAGTSSSASHGTPAAGSASALPGGSDTGNASGIVSASGSSSTANTSSAPPAAPRPKAPTRASFAFMRRHPAHWVALGFGSGLSPRAPGTVGTLWAWVAFLMLDPWLAPHGPAAWGAVIALALALGVWAATRTAQHLATADPGAIVWDEVVAFWIVLWVVTPAGFLVQAAAFALFRFFDAAKPGPVRWADRLFKLPAGQPIGWAQGFGILFDDLVAAGCTLMFVALWVRIWNT